MATTTKRKRRADPTPKGLAPGEQLKRSALVGRISDPAWGWVGTDVHDPAGITPEHRMRACGLYRESKHSYCSNKYASQKAARDKSASKQEVASGELDDDVIVISDDEPPPCSKKLCRGNPNCLNYLGQDKWEREDKAKEAFVKACISEDNPVLDARDPDVPVGLKNLGATCYANAFLQVWFRDLAFRNAVYQCQPPPNSHHIAKFEDSPIFQLQVTFAALQESTQGVFNPTRLVESLKLSTTEQQDAQEFSKLFMSHLDAEFRKQAIPTLRSLIPDQFEGKQIYGTTCDACGHCSERPSDFLEIEINFANNARLEDCIAAMLQPEKLEGDNQYLCAACDSLQDATRTTTLLTLPPVLHFSLLRFVYDLKSMERKKSKNGIVFPRVLDMRQFVRAEGRGNAKEGTKEEADCVYELKGVLLHKGASAYHGHYEAQVWDATNNAWFQFDDETVTKIKMLGDKRKPEPAGDDSSTSRKPKPKPKKATKRRVESEDEDEYKGNAKGTPPTVVNLNGKARADDIYSKDAYMLVYTLRDPRTAAGSNSGCGTSGNGDAIPEPPQRVMEVVDQLNATHDELCDTYIRKVKDKEREFDTKRRAAMDIYRSWSVESPQEDCVIVDQEILKRWLSAPFDEERTGSPSETSSSIACEHGYLNPGRGENMKRIVRASCEKLNNEGVDLRGYSPEDVCTQCVETQFTERLYGFEHPQDVTRFEEANEIAENGDGFWISKAWLKDWKSAKPRMHDTGNGDPAPDDPDFEGHVKCEHGNLSLNVTARRRISSEACDILHDLFPTWETLSTNTEECAACAALIHISKSDKRESRKQAEDEKATLKHMHDNALTGSNFDLENVPCAIVPAQFVKAWKKWLSRPGEATRPEIVDNAPFFCEHGKLIIDPNCPGDLSTTVTIVKRSDWDALADLYSAGPLIALEKRLVEEEMFDTKYVHDIPTCAECRHQNKLDYDTAEITVRILTRQDPDPTPSTYSQHDALEIQSKPKSTVTYGRSAAGTRKSTRIKHVRDKGGKRKLMISKQSTVKDIKVQLQEQLNIPAVYQRLFYQGLELEDNARDAASLGILADDILHLREDLEDDAHATDSDTGPVKKQRREEGKAFVGTLLGGSSPATSRSPTEVMEMDVDTQTSSPIVMGPKCSACTFVNTPNASACDMCDNTLLA
ncbi:cysteine proteinase [Athelia psychrophila]|uniref:Cysteine proteinase n=1 Tax=Athelia psychrophila TaxID=1759441 RepID=A0A166BG70_9AGAM|nr:cysteine proteinase [Fibularhizoctonia sp. CBS 109695]